MDVIEKFSKYKDVADLIYRALHQLHMDDLLKEYKSLKDKRYLIGKARSLPVLYSETNADLLNPPCFGWRGDSGGSWRDSPIYHMSHKNGEVYETLDKCPPNYCLGWN